MSILLSSQKFLTNSDNSYSSLFKVYTEILYKKLFVKYLDPYIEQHTV
jgi:hypothetical protein